jgi:hypothetical protein
MSLSAGAALWTVPGQALGAGVDKLWRYSPSDSDGRRSLGGHGHSGHGGHGQSGVGVTWADLADFPPPPHEKALEWR